MQELKLTLIDRSKDLIDAWTEAFDDVENVDVVCGDLFSLPADGIVSPANSFGIMDGGIDAAIGDHRYPAGQSPADRAPVAFGSLRAPLGFSVEDRVQELILEQFYGELPVGCAVVVETEDDRWKYLISAPTMRVPENVAHTINAYLAFERYWSRIGSSTPPAQGRFPRLLSRVWVRG